MKQDEKLDGKYLLPTCDQHLSAEDILIVATASGSTIVITGEDFRSGPTIEIFDDFDAGKPGEMVQRTATVGSWSQFGTNTPYYIADGAGNVAAGLIDNDTMHQIILDFYLLV